MTAFKNWLGQPVEVGSIVVKTFRHSSTMTYKIGVVQEIDIRHPRYSGHPRPEAKIKWIFEDWTSHYPTMKPLDQPRPSWNEISTVTVLLPGDLPRFIHPEFHYEYDPIGDAVKEALDAPIS